MKKILFFLFITGSVGMIKAQQLTQYSQYFKNQYAVNPAAAGMNEFVDIKVIGRTQWVGMTNAPVSSNTYFSMPLSKERISSSRNSIGGSARESQIGTGKLKHAIGAQFMTDQYGAFKRMLFNGTYAIHVPINNDINVSFGTNLGLTGNSFLSDRAVTLTPDQDPTYMSSGANLASRNILIIGAGFYAYSKSFFGGISMDQITKDKISLGQGISYYDPKMHIDIIGGAKLKINREITITPSFLWKYMKKSPLSLDVSVLGSYQDLIWTSVTYRTNDAIVLGVGYNITNRFRVAYSYDITTSKLRNVSSGSHEIMLGIMLDRK